MASYYLKSTIAAEISLSTYLMQAGACSTATNISAGTIAGSGGTVTFSYVTEQTLPSNTSWGTQSFTVQLKITTANTNVTASATAKNTGSGQTSSASSGVTCALGNITLNIPSTAFTANSANDRIQITITFTNSASMSGTGPSWETNTVNSFLTSSITEFSGSTPGTVLAASQYASDRKTLVAAAGTTGTDANTTTLYLDNEVYSKGPEYNMTSAVEAQPTTTSFTNTANFSSKSYSMKTGTLISARRGSSVNYDSINKRYLVYGGNVSGTRVNELWHIDASQMAGRWLKLSPTGTLPSGYNLCASTQVNLNGKSWFILFGGSNSTGSAPVTSMSICDCTTVGSEAWTTYATQGGTAPPAMWYITHHLVTVPTSSTTADIYLLCGADASITYSAVYKFTLNLASTVPGSITWTQTLGNTTGGAARDGAFCAYDSTNNRILMAGGFGTINLTDAWQYSVSNVTWQQLNTSLSTSAFVGRELVSGGWDQANQRMILYSGWTVSGQYSTSLNDIWQVDYSSAGHATFTRLKASVSLTGDQDFLAMNSAGSATDTDKNLIVEFGQYAADSDTDKYVYAYDLSTTAGSTAGANMWGLNVQDTFRGRDAPAYCYDSDQGNLMLINGYSQVDDDMISGIPRGDHHNEAWAYNITNNTLRYTNKGYIGMPYKEGVMAVYDTTGKRIITYGGLTGTQSLSGGVWELTADASSNYQARPMAPSGSPPLPRWLMAAAYDSTNNRIIYWGGESHLTVFSDMWSLSLASGDGIWSQLSPTGTAPTGVWQPGFANDTTNKRLYVYGGSVSVSDGGTYSSQLFYVDYSPTPPTAPVYHVLSPTGGVTGRGKSMAYDATNGNLVVFGGFAGSTTSQQIQYLAVPSGTAWTSATPTISPGDRRSAAATFQGGKLYIGAGRQASLQFWNDIWALTPNYTTFSSSTWVAQSPPVYQRFQQKITGEVNGNYHWQGQATINGTAAGWASFTHDPGSHIDYTVGPGGFSGRLTSVGFELNSLTAGVEITGHNFNSGTASSISTAQVHSGTYSAVYATTSNFSIDYVQFSTTGISTLYARAYFYFTGYPSANCVIFESGSSSTSIGGAYINSSGQAGVAYKVGATLTYGTTLSSALSLNAWHYIEINNVSSAANSQTIVVSVDGSIIDTETGSATFAAGAQTWLVWGAYVLGTGANIASMYVDDIVANTSDYGATAQNSWAGAGNLAIVRPAGAGDSNTFATQVGGTAGSANNYTRVDEVTPDNATSYNASDTAGTSDFFTVGSSSIPGTANINVVQVGGTFANITAADAATTVRFQIEKSSANTLYQSAFIVPNSTTWVTNATTSTVGYPITLPTDPTGANWTTTTVGSMEVGYALTTAGTNSIGVTDMWAYIDYLIPALSFGSTLFTLGVG